MTQETLRGFFGLWDIVGYSCKVCFYWIDGLMTPSFVVIILIDNGHGIWAICPIFDPSPEGKPDLTFFSSWQAVARLEMMKRRMAAEDFWMLIWNPSYHKLPIS